MIYHFIQGYTSKMAGTEVGISETTAAFSSCYGEPFLVWCVPLSTAECRGRPPKTCAWQPGRILAAARVATLPLCIRWSQSRIRCCRCLSPLRANWRVECVWRSKPVTCGGALSCKC